MNAIDYLRAAVRQQASNLDSVQIPRIERTRENVAANEGHLSKFRKITCYPDDGCLPLTYPFIVSFPSHFANMLDPRFPMKMLGMVHIKMQIEQKRPVGAGERLDYLCYLEGQKLSDKGIETELVTEARSRGVVIWRSIATLLTIRKIKKSSDKDPKPAFIEPADTVRQVWKISSQIARDYARVSGDFNPIHLSNTTARLFGFKRCIIHGMWSLSRIAGVHIERFRRPPTYLECDFKLPVFLPAKVSYRFWKSDGGIAFRLTDELGTKPHVIGKFSFANS